MATSDTASRDILTLSLASLSVGWYVILWTLGTIGCVAASVLLFRIFHTSLTVHSRRRFRLRPRSPLSSAAASSVPGVTIIRPLKGLETNLYENLESTFTQEYPNYEIFFCVDDDDDQALPVVRDLMVKYPHVHARITIRKSYGLDLHVHSSDPHYLL